MDDRHGMIYVTNGSKLRHYQHFIYFIFIIILPHTVNYKGIKMIIYRLINIKFKICTLLGRSDCGGKISEKPSL